MSSAERSERPYEVFTTRYDKVVEADDLIRDHRLDVSEQADRIRGQLEILRETMESEDGPDPSGLHVCLVVSMGASARHVIHRAMAATIHRAEILEAAGARVSILGYTTSAWSGGQSRRDWKAAGSQGHPGRLCDLLHVVLKDEDRSVEESMDALAAAAHPSVMKENVDGEGLEWAYERAIAVGGDRIAMVHVTDKASPHDDSTLGLDLFDRSFLRRHRDEVVRRISDEGRVQLGLAVLGAWGIDRASMEKMLEGTYPTLSFADDRGIVEEFSHVLREATRDAILALPAPGKAPSAPRP